MKKNPTIYSFLITRSSMVIMCNWYCYQGRPQVMALNHPAGCGGPHSQKKMTFRESWLLFLLSYKQHKPAHYSRIKSEPLSYFVAAHNVVAQNTANIGESIRVSCSHHCPSDLKPINTH